MIIDSGLLLWATLYMPLIMVVDVLWTTTQGGPKKLTHFVLLITLSNIEQTISLSESGENLL